jgi:hypothetical protein
MDKTKSETDWNRVLAFKEGSPIPYEPEDGPYDPNDAEAARAWLAQADLIRRAKESFAPNPEAKLLDALQTGDLVIAPEELQGRSLVSLLREKLARR